MKQPVNSGPSMTYGTGTRELMIKKRPLQGINSRGLSSRWTVRKVREKRPYTTSNPFSAFVVSR